MSSVEFFYESESDDNEENVPSMAVQRKLLRDKSNPLEMPEVLFIKNFRLNKPAFKYLLNKVENKLPATIRSSSVSPILKLCAAMRFFAEGSYQTGAGNEYLASVSQPTFSKNLQQIIDVLEGELCPEVIKFPTSDEEKRKIKLSFFEKYDGFPGVIGCIDGTHVKIVAPPKNERHLYYNRKGFFSLNVMLVCDHQMFIRFVDGNHAGSYHDSYIFNSSELDTHLQQRFENGDVNTWLLGDAGYALKPYLIVPFRSTQNEHPRQKKFNEKHTKARNIIERTIGVLKTRFRCILGARQLHYSPDKARQIVNVCCALHNLCIMYKVNTGIPVTVPTDEEVLAPLESAAPGIAGVRIREQIMNSICQ